MQSDIMVTGDVMYKQVMCVLSGLMLCSCVNGVQRDVDTPECQSYRAMMTAPQQPEAASAQRHSCEKSRSEKQESKRLLISYQQELKPKLMAAIDGAGLPLIYDLKNMNIVVVAAPEEMAEKYIEYFSSLDGVYGVQEDCVMHLN
ncbi:hypothetical protein FMK74_27070 [Klebsiella pneumoniae]|uniref:hypothetical protein n=1 Tax=Klebsiella TaxID=570 RepID=UPI001EE9C78A|nr:MULTISPECIES: hypothetical protein [Klebsiella]EKU9431083.1 hypothetical protein [Klebsiella variicola]MBZ6673846.1 hypothetical protein [Klebsiella pneumoniae]MBZ7249402.1 hypothetical protein [Klebsiella pneumoniae]UXO81838.1 hypothetical protein N7918_29450 [Klebsiella michiganensis]